MAGMAAPGTRGRGNMPVEGLEVEISEDRTTAYISYTPPEGGSDVGLDLNVVLADIESRFRIQGINHDLLQSLLDAYNSSGEIFEHVEIASTGKPMVPGKNAWLEWCIETEPQIEEDSQGRVDFYSFSALKNVNANQLIARVHPPEPGSDGLAVTGEPMPAVPVTDIAYAPGENVEYDETNHEFFSKIAGRVEVKGTVISVLRLFEVAGDVDFSVGNVQFDGLVKVRGNIKDNFNIAATDGVEVDGVIEGAHVKSNRNVVAMGGINLREKGSINCE
ncbi:MAG: DUF342 domain-containing protein, partial [Planctomycetaceae bacterium]|nr:DUF342 domain-containing protein [Planctomycetaceae bacterium]